jgi:hypothetical protein
VAIKKVFQDKRYKNREHQIIQDINHPNCVKLRDQYFTQGKNVQISESRRRRSISTWS